jgi:hypothetical protein
MKASRGVPMPAAGNKTYLGQLSKHAELVRSSLGGEK